MKLLIKQTVFSALEHFTVTDEAGNVRFEVKSPMGFRVGLKLHISDANGAEVALINQKAFSFQPTFRVFRNGTQTATIIKKFTLVSQKYEVPELGWTVKGDFLAHDYCIFKDSEPIMLIRKEWFAWGDTFVLDIVDEAHLIEALAVVLAIDCVVDEQGNGIKVNGRGIDGIFN